MVVEALERGFTEILFVCVCVCVFTEKGDSKGFLTNFETFFLQVSVTISHLSSRERVKKKKRIHLLKRMKNNNGTDLGNKLKFNDCRENFFSKSSQ